LPNSELLLPADGQKIARDICIPALTKEGLDPSSVVLYLVSDMLCTCVEGDNMYTSSCLSLLIVVLDVVK